MRIREGREWHEKSYAEMLVVEGPNGCGKTSLLRILAGLSRYGFDGTVHRPQELLFLGHHSAVKGLLSPRENLAWHVDGLNQPDNEAIDHALERVGLYGYEDVPSHNLSAGQHRRVNLARLYLSRVELWILDEPFTAIDKGGVADLEALFQEHVGKGGAIAITSHQPLGQGVQRFSLSEGFVA